jgi:arginase family enzyme
MEIEVYLEPINERSIGFDFQSEPDSRLGHVIDVYRLENGFPDYTQANIALIGVPEDRSCQGNAGSASAPNEIRTPLYHLFSGFQNPKIVDLGNIKPGNEINDTYFALTEVINGLLEYHVLPIVIGGSQDLTRAIYQAFERRKRVINIAAIDSRFDMGNENSPLNSKTYLSKIIMQQPNYLFNYTNIGYQTYFVDQDSIELMDKLFFDVFRLGTIHNNIFESEPLLRSADLLSIDIAAVRQSDSPACEHASPNGFSGEELCQMTRFAGMSDKLSVVGFFEYNPILDNNHQSAHLFAQAIWYLIDGYYGRKKELLSANKEQFVKYFVSIQDGAYDIVFYKSKKSDRWWMEVPYPQDKKDRYERHYLVPCSYKDYETACQEDIPERWWQALKKMV